MEGSAKRVLGYQRWASLLFLHWPVSSVTLRPLIPERLEIDTFEGQAYVSLAAFTVVDARLRILPVPLTFHELNARTYVRLPGGATGVWFFSLDATSALASALARLALRLPYFPARISRERVGNRFRYESQRRGRPAQFQASWEVAGEAEVAQPNTLAHFLVERYALFSRGFGRKLWWVPVKHRPWLLRSVRDLQLKQTLDVEAGLGICLVGSPAIAQYSERVDVTFDWAGWK